MSDQGSWCVDIIESERGWGQRLDETIVFGPNGKDRTRALAYVEQYNAQNTAASAPDWYMQANAPYFVDKTPTGPKVSKAKR